MLSLYIMLVLALCGLAMVISFFYFGITMGIPAFIRFGREFKKVTKESWRKGVEKERLRQKREGLY